MELVIEWLPRLIACAIFALLALALWFAGTRIGKRISKRRPLGTAHRPLTAASYAFLAVCVVVFVQLSFRTLGVVPNEAHDNFVGLLGFPAASSFVGSVGILLLLAIRKIFGSALQALPSGLHGVGRHTGWLLSVMYLLPVGVTAAVIPRYQVEDLAGDPGTTLIVLARVFTALGQAAIIGIFIWQLVPAFKSALTAEGSHESSDDQANALDPDL